MSETVYYTGKIKKVDTKDLNNIDYIKKYVKDNNLKKPKWLSNNDYNIFELLDAYGLFEKFVEVEDELYEVLEKFDLNIYDDLYEGDLNLDDEIEFTVKYYNGGCSFPEAINEVVESIKKRSDE